MKQLTKIALTGALALGGLGATSVADIPNLSPSKAEAAYVQDDFNGVSWKMVENNMDPYVDVKPSYKTGDTFTFEYGAGYTNRYQPTHLKIYKIAADGKLQRLKTMYATQVTYPDPENGDSYGYKFTTPITSTYTAGTYIAVHTYQYEYAGGDYAMEQDRSLTFTINK